MQKMLSPKWMEGSFVENVSKLKCLIDKGVEKPTTHESQEIGFAPNAL